LKSKLMSMYLPKRLELSFRFVLALPNASRIQFDCSRMFFTLHMHQATVIALTAWSSLCVSISDGVKEDTSLQAKATVKDFTYKATGNKIKIKQQSIHLQ